MNEFNLFPGYFAPEKRKRVSLHESGLFLSGVGMFSDVELALVKVGKLTCARQKPLSFGKAETASIPRQDFKNC